MADPQSSPTTQPQSTSLSRPNFPMLYYGLVVVATAAVVLVLYNLIIVKWCSDHRRPPQRISHRQHPSMMWRVDNTPINSITSFEYEGDGKGLDGGGECVVCLSVFEQGEEIRQLPICKHYFHAPCIDMWLHSHLDCPLCRSPVALPPTTPHAEVSEHSREGLLLGAAALV